MPQLKWQKQRDASDTLAVPHLNWQTTPGLRKIIREVGPDSARFAWTGQRRRHAAGLGMSYLSIRMYVLKGFVTC